MQIVKRTMNWIQRPSMFEEAETARLKRKAYAQSDIAKNSTLSSGLIGSGISSTTEAVNLTLRIAAARVQSGVNVKKS
ncbi:MAG: hypothetical protein IPK28_22375 [Devosia sp.]|nr:hypothetical protein [Devosia sp.]